MTFQEAQGDQPILYLDGQALPLDADAMFALGDDAGARVQVEWDGIANGYTSTGYRCGYCGQIEETALEAYRHARDDHSHDAHDAQIARVEALVNSAAIDWNGDDLTVTISTGDPRGAFAMTVRVMDDGTRLLHVPHPSNGLLHEPLTELHPGTYKIGY